jgi:hypothetical protein
MPPPLGMPPLPGNHGAPPLPAPMNAAAPAAVARKPSAPVASMIADV